MSASMRPINPNGDGTATARIVPPATVRREWIQGDPNRVLISADQERLITYDPETLAGGAYHLHGRYWQTFHPLTLDEFLEVLKLQGIGFESPAVRDAWIRSVGHYELTA